jgi:uncharacterized protein (TIGR03083 family)
MSDATGLLEAQAAATRQIVDSTVEADFAKDTLGCPGWRVQDVVAHLTTGAQVFRGYALETINAANLVEERARFFAEACALPAGELKRRFADTDRQLVETFGGMSPQELQAMRTHPVFGTVAVSMFLGLRISELAIHGWDVQSTGDPEARLEAPALVPVAERIADAFPGWFVPEKIASMDRAYRFVVGAPVNQDRILTIADGRAFWGGDTTQPDATLTLDGGDFLLLMAGRLSSEKLIQSGRARAEGDLGDADELSTLFRAYGGR